MKITLNGTELDLDALKEDALKPREKPETVKYSFSGNTLTVGGVLADINITPAESPKIEVAITGPKSLIDDIVVCESDGDVSMKSAGKGGTNIMTVRSGGRVMKMTQFGSGSIQINSIKNGGVSINYGGEDQIATVNVSLPVETPIRLFGVMGDVSIGDIKGSLRVNISGSNSVYAESVKKLHGYISGSNSVYAESVKKLHGYISGSGDLTVENAFGDVSVQASGSGDINIRDGKIDNLEAETSGSGDIKIDAAVQIANLHTSGSGDIYVARVTKMPHKHASGSGDIRIGLVG